MEAPLGQKRQSGFANRPKALVCYICGREFGTKSLPIHLKSCAKKWEDQESKKPKHLRRPVPQPTSELPIGASRSDIERHNEQAMKTFETQAMKQCPHCQRTFLEDRLEIHLRSCTAEKPHKPVSKPKDPEQLPISPAPEDSQQAPPTLVNCPVCDRKFAEDRLPTHQAICEKAKTKQRAVFPSSSQRVIDPIMTHPQSSEDVKSDPEKWRREHEDFVEAMKFVKSTPVRHESVATPSNDYVHCPHCNRNFAPHVAERHIPTCKFVTHRPKPPPNRLSVTMASDARPKSPQPQVAAKPQGKKRPETATVRRSLDSVNTQPIVAKSVECPQCKEMVSVEAFFEHVQRCQPHSEEPPQRPQTAPVKIFCPMCGTKYLPEGRFCATCGVKR